MFPAASHTLRLRTPILAALAAALMLAVPSTTASAQAGQRHCANATANPTSVSIRQAQRATLCLLNKKRRAHGLRKLHENGRLDLASVRHAQDMVRRDYFEHGNFIGRIRSTSYLSGARSWTVGENIAWGSGELATPVAIVKAWMHSPGHRRNILDGQFREIGIGIARGTPSGGDDGATYATDFGARG
ncbi:MAG TPA: CAP domain-containing protein [Thermoleophilaceae bacterium]|jgi:uncharacterized protein YkwD